MYVCIYIYTQNICIYILYSIVFMYKYMCVYIFLAYKHIQI